MLVIRKEGYRWCLPYLQEFAPCIEDFLQTSVDVRIQEEVMPARSTHGPVKDGVHRNAYHAHVLGCIRPYWSSCCLLSARCHTNITKHNLSTRLTQNMIQNLQHLMIISELLVTGRIMVVWLLDRNLLEHGICEHEDASVVFN
jgi:hypothetical protein